MGYTYYNTPDGQDCDKKALYLVRKAGIVGLFLSSGYVLLVDTPPSYSQILGRFARITIPCVAAAAAGAVAVCTLLDIRKTDDQMNHFYGGVIGGIAGGLAKGHFGHGIVAGLVLGGIAAVVKDSKMNNYDLNKADFRPNVDDFWTKDYDWRVSKQIPRDWVAK